MPLFALGFDSFTNNNLMAKFAFVSVHLKVAWLTVWKSIIWCISSNKSTLAFSALEATLMPHFAQNVCDLARKRLLASHAEVSWRCTPLAVRHVFILDKLTVRKRFVASTAHKALRVPVHIQSLNSSSVQPFSATSTETIFASALVIAREAVRSLVRFLEPTFLLQVFSAVVAVEAVGMVFPVECRHSRSIDFFVASVTAVICFAFVAVLF
mmetsp:Transcript_17925/g.24987  ORF Transcript_17925/g.24987 Transcript_17925/m.24987 type:complete len:211 (-) Transcript_17925:1184-1816(-)